MRSGTVLVAGITLAAAFGCYGLTDGTPSGGGNGGPTDVPCDVANVLGSKCNSCHGATPTKGVPVSLTSAATLKAPSASDPSKTNAEVSVARMKAGTMPPGGGATGDTAALEAWIAAGYPAGNCSAGDGGSSTYPGPAVCTNGKGWTDTKNGDPLMVPGQACIDCHTTKQEATDPQTTFWVAGTVFPTGREQNDCKGVGAGVTVEITDANKKTYTLTPNAVGNFALAKVTDKFPGAATFAYPYTAVVKVGSAVRPMGGAQTSGDCNTCHGEPPTGGAPGRIVVPGWNP